MEGRTTKDEKGEKGREGKGEDSLDLLTGKNFLATPLQKNLCIICKKLQSLDSLVDFRHSDPHAPSNLEYAPKICQNALALADGALPQGRTTMGELTMLPISPNRLGIVISPPSRTSPISLHRRCRRLDPRRSLPCMTDSLNKSLYVS